MNIKKIFYPINLSSILHLIILIYKDKSPIRIFHNYFLKSKPKYLSIAEGQADTICKQTFFQSTYLF